MNILHNLIIILTLTIQNLTYIGFMIYLSEHSLKKLTSPKFLVSFCIYSVVLNYLQKHDNNQLMFAFLLMFAFYSLMIFIKMYYKPGDKYIYCRIFYSFLLSGCCHACFSSLKFEF